MSAAQTVKASSLIRQHQSADVIRRLARAAVDDGREGPTALLRREALHRPTRRRQPARQVALVAARRRARERSSQSSLSLPFFFSFRAFSQRTVSDSSADSSASRDCSELGAPTSGSA